MSRKLKIMSIFGTRPEAIKMCPLVKELEGREEFESVVCVTAQHREMLDSVLSCFELSPDYDLDIMEKGQTIEGITSKVLEKLSPVLAEVKPDAVLVHGDTTTAFASALAAFYSQIPVGHVEAGLRTFDKYSPFPEEMNRCLIGRIADFHFSPTSANKENLLKESVGGKIFITGNTVIDAMKYTVNARPFTDKELQNTDFGKRVITITCHRRENYGEPMENIFRAIRALAERHGDALFIYPVHLSPVVRQCASKHLGDVSNIKLIEPLDAMDMHKLLSKSYMVMTDSGGLQEEAPALGKPVLVLRRETERPEAVRAGTVKLAGTDADTIIALAEELLLDSEKYDEMAHAVNPYGDGNASKRIADALAFSFGLSTAAPEEFRP
ncbi:MAG: UDP-N-acetylglucosamine 2-epimerase (non-hydrolyzing) [Oscillospiraceae bacterium]|nr:UDP-N-acetylglucosamine 2-epimerase (non-hydrolyzing) [Oscillospiraceae bacterium]